MYKPFLRILKREIKYLMIDVTAEESFKLRDGFAKAMAQRCKSLAEGSADFKKSAIAAAH
jgi:hypothetical protein